VNTKKRKLSPVALSAFIGAGLLVVLALGLFLVVLPQKSKAADIGKEIVATQAQIVQARADLSAKLAVYNEVQTLVKAGNPADIELA